jgi:hypothetical protein
MRAFAYGGIFLLTVSLSCGSPESHQPSQMAADSEDVKPDAGCFQYRDSANLVVLHIANTADSIMGRLYIRYAGKDVNMGDFAGVMNGDVLLSNYRFTSEGVTGMRQVAFRKVGDDWTEGFGESVDSGGVVRFRDTAALTFPGTFIVRRINCDSTAVACYLQFGEVRSLMDSTCVDTASMPIKLHPLVDGSIVNGPKAYAWFSEDRKLAEVFLPGEQEGTILMQTAKGNWENKELELSVWKGYILKRHGQLVYGGQ